MSKAVKAIGSGLKSIVKAVVPIAVTAGAAFLTGGASLAVKAAVGAAGVAFAAGAIMPMIGPRLASGPPGGIGGGGYSGGIGDAPPPFQDPGLRQQLQPSTDNKLPVIYGKTFTKGTIIDARISESNQLMTYVLALGERPQTGTITIDNVWWGDRKLTIGTFDINLNPVLSGFPSILRLNVRRPNTVMSATNSDGTSSIDLRGLIRVWTYRNGSNDPTPGLYPSFPWSQRDRRILTGPAGVIEDIPFSDQIVPGWTPDWTMSNTIFAVVQLQYNLDRGITGLQPMTFEITNTVNRPGDVLLDYMTNTRYGAGIPIGDIDLPSLTAFNTHCDEIVSYKDSTGQTVTGPKYRINGLLSTHDTVKNNLDRIMLASNAWLVFNYNSGKWKVIPNRAATTAEKNAAVVLNDRNILSDITLTTTDLNQLYNAVEVEYNNGLNRDQRDFVRIELPQELRNSLEPDNQYKMFADLVNSNIQATRIGNIYLKQAREELAVEFDADYNTLTVDAGDVVKITNTLYGWNEKLFRVISINERDQNDGTLVANIKAIEYNDDVYTEEEITEFTPAPNTNIPLFQTTPTPQAPRFVSETRNTRLPSFRFRGIIPAGNFDTVEWFYSEDGGRNYERYSQLRKGAGQQYVGGETVIQEFRGFNNGIYNFAFRVTKETFQGPLSPASANYVWRPLDREFSEKSTSIEVFSSPVIIPQDLELQESVVGQRIALELRNGLQIVPISTATDDVDMPNNSWRLLSTGQNAQDDLLTLETEFDEVFNSVDLVVTNWQYQQDFPITIEPVFRYKDNNGVFEDLNASVEIRTQLPYPEPILNTEEVQNIYDGKLLKLDYTSNNFFVPSGVALSDTHLYTPSNIEIKARTMNLNGGVMSIKAFALDGTEITLSGTGNTRTLSNTAFGNRDSVTVYVEYTDEFFPRKTSDLQEDDDEFRKKVYYDQIVITRVGEDINANVLISSNDYIQTIDTNWSDGIIADGEVYKTHIGVYENGVDRRPEWDYSISTPIGIQNINVDNIRDNGFITPAPITSFPTTSFASVGDIATIDVEARKLGEAPIYKTIAFIKNREDRGKKNTGIHYQNPTIPNPPDGPGDYKLNQDIQFPSGNLFPMKDVKILGSRRYFTQQMVGFPTLQTLDWAPRNIVLKACPFNLNGPLTYNWTGRWYNYQGTFGQIPSSENFGPSVDLGKTPIIQLSRETVFSQMALDPFIVSYYSAAKAFEITLEVTDADNNTWTDKQKIYVNQPLFDQWWLEVDYMKVAVDSNGDVIQPLSLFFDGEFIGGDKAKGVANQLARLSQASIPNPQFTIAQQVGVVGLQIDNEGVFKNINETRESFRGFISFQRGFNVPRDITQNEAHAWISIDNINWRKFTIVKSIQ